MCQAGGDANRAQACLEEELCWRSGNAFSEGWLLRQPQKDEEVFGKLLVDNVEGCLSQRKSTDVQAKDIVEK